jgi:hypothetical protein
MSSPESSAAEESKPIRLRRTRLIIAQENKQILDYLVKGYTHDQIRRSVNLNEKNYWKRIAAIRKRDLEIVRREQTPESFAFAFKRTEEKLHNLEIIGMEMATDNRTSVRDRIEAMHFLRQIYEDELSIFLHGPSNYLVKEASSATSGGSAVPPPGMEKFPPPSPSSGLDRWPWNENRPEADHDPNRVF